jgi:hypothetical protein
MSVIIDYVYMYNNSRDPATIHSAELCDLGVRCELCMGSSQSTMNRRAECGRRIHLWNVGEQVSRLHTCLGLHSALYPMQTQFHNGHIL